MKKIRDFCQQLLTQLASYKTIIIYLRKFSTKKLLIFKWMSLVFSVQTLIFFVEILMLTPSLKFRVLTSNLGY